jgi:hypothetical protein
VLSFEVIESGKAIQICVHDEGLDVLRKALTRVTSAGHLHLRGIANGGNELSDVNPPFDGRRKMARMFGVTANSVRMTVRQTTRAEMATDGAPEGSTPAASGQDDLVAVAATSDAATEAMPTPRQETPEMLEVHAPHEPIQSWRHFLIHMATITLGLLLALSLEQAIEWQHAAHRASEARENIRVEIADNLGSMELRTGCLRHRTVTVSD